MGRAYWLGKIGPKDYFEVPYDDIMIEGKTKYGTWITMSEISWRDHGVGRFGIWLRPEISAADGRPLVEN
jgi:hypothetical protein